MFHDFLTSNRDTVIERCRKRAAIRSPQAPAGVELGVPLFLKQLVDILRVEQQTPDRNGDEVTPTTMQMGRAASLNGAQLLRSGYNVDQVVHFYGDVCQVVTGLAVEQRALIEIDEFRTFNRCLNVAIAHAVTAFSGGSDERRRLIDVAVNTFAAIQTGNLGLKGATAEIHTTALLDLRKLLGSSA